MLYSLYISFTEWNLFGAPEFVGLKNYITIFRDPRFYESLKNTLLFIAGYLPVVLVLSMGIALLLNSKVKRCKYFRGSVLSSGNYFLGCGIYDLERTVKSGIWNY